MSRHVEFSVSSWSKAAPDVVYGLLSSGATWPRWSPIGTFRLESEGESGGESVGAVRVFKTGGLGSREKLLELRPGEGISYTVLSGFPIRNHRADVTLETKDGGTSIVWREEFDAKLAGTGSFSEWFLRKFMKRCVDGLARHAAQIPRTDG